MADEDNKSSSGKSAGKDQGAALPAAEELTVPKEVDMITAPQTTPTESVRAVALCPIYYRPGFPPHNPGDSLSVCVVTARHWLAAGLIRLEPGEKLPELPASGRSDFLVFSPSGTPAPASQV